jgi:hypothetical protein
VRIFPRVVAGVKQFVAEFSIGYLSSTPTQLQQKELCAFFEILPHNPLKLKCDGSQVFLGASRAVSDGVATDGRSWKGFRIMKELSLAQYSLQAVAEVLDYLLMNIDMFLGRPSL